MWYEIVGCRQVKEEGSNEFLVLGSMEPLIVELDKGRGTTMIGKEAVMVRVEEVVVEEVFEDLVNDSSLHKFANFDQVGDRSIVFCQGLVIVVNVSIDSLTGGDTIELVLCMAVIPVGSSWITQGAARGLQGSIQKKYEIKKSHPPTTCFSAAKLSPKGVHPKYSCPFLSKFLVMHFS